MISSASSGGRSGRSGRGWLSWASDIRIKMQTRGRDEQTIPTKPEETDFPFVKKPLKNAYISTVSLTPPLISDSHLSHLQMYNLVVLRNFQMPKLQASYKK